MIKVQPIKPNKFIQFIDGLIHAKGELVRCWVNYKTKKKQEELDFDRKFYSEVNKRQIENFKYYIDRERFLDPCHIKSRKYDEYNKIIEALETKPYLTVRQAIKNKLKELKTQGIPDGNDAKKAEYFAKFEAFTTFINLGEKL